ncbi:MAG: hypothetical protein WA136_00050 [Rhodoferax sp.]
MRQTGIYNYFVFGFNYSAIKRNGLLDETKAIALEYLDEFFEFLIDLDLQVTDGVAAKLKTIAAEIRESSETQVSELIAKRIKAEGNKIDAALDAELQLKKAYVLTKKRYSLDALLGTPRDLLASGVYDRLSDNAKRDYRLACLQVALNQPTAAAFHLMRMLEEQVKVLYFAFKKTKRLEKPMWGPMTQQLRSKRAPKPSEKLLDHLDGMRVHFRNPTQHPQAFYSIDEAQDLLNQTIAAVNIIHAELPK